MPHRPSRKKRLFDHGGDAATLGPHQACKHCERSGKEAHQREAFSVRNRLRPIVLGCCRKCDRAGSTLGKEQSKVILSISDAHGETAVVLVAKVAGITSWAGMAALATWGGAHGRHEKSKEDDALHGWESTKSARLTLVATAYTCGVLEPKWIRRRICKPC